VDAVEVADRQNTGAVNREALQLLARELTHTAPRAPSLLVCKAEPDTVSTMGGVVGDMRGVIVAPAFMQGKPDRGE
jgi:hypothetical protein